MSRTLTPHSLDAERSVLGAVLIDNRQYEHVRSLVRSDEFFRTAHRVIFDAIGVLIRRDQTADLVTVTEALRLSGALDDVGGPVYVAGLIDGVPMASNVNYYAEIVKEHALRRQLIAASQDVMAAAQATDATIEALLDRAEAALTSIGAERATDLVAGSSLATEALAWLDEMSSRQTGGRLSGISTGLSELDALTDGLQPGELVLIGARPSQGKTALGLQMALACEAPAAFFSLEMRRAQLAARALAWLARVDGWALRRGRLTPGEYERVSRALTTLSDSGLAIDDASDLTVWQIRSKARRWQAQHGLSLVVVDYVQLVTPTTDRGKQRNREQEVATMSRAFKGLAKDLGVPVLVLAQLNRSVEGRADTVPKLSDLRESGALEQDADVVLFLHRADGKTVKDDGPAQIIVAKNRNGPTGTVDAWWVPSMTAFRPMGQAS